MGQVLQGGEQRRNRMAHLGSFAARRSSGSHPLKTRASRECAELFSPFSSCDCQCASNSDLRDNRSTMDFAQSEASALQCISDAAGESLILILSDINMPGMSGLELLPKAKALRPDVLTHKSSLIDVSYAR
jgi:hypothetical protein